MDEEINQTHFDQSDYDRFHDRLVEEAKFVRDGLKQIGALDSGDWLDIIEARVASEQTGATWILKHWHEHSDTAALVTDYLDNARTNTPVHLWAENRSL